MLQSQWFRLIRGVGGNYWVHSDTGKEIQVFAPGIFRKSQQKPLVGDWVFCEETHDEKVPLRMQKIKNRVNVLPRPSIANIDMLWLVIPLTEPEPDLWVLDKMLVIAEHRQIPVKIIFTKDDIANDEDRKLIYIYQKLPYTIEVSSFHDTVLLEKLRSEVPGKLLALAGPSGAGKSTLLNRILGEEMMPTQAISSKLGRGKHTTRHVELFPFNGGYLADTPGFSSLDLFQAGVGEEELVRAYPEIWDKQNDCRYLSCKHLTEPACAVKSASDIDPGRLERYQGFRKELEEKNDYERKPY